MGIFNRISQISSHSKEKSIVSRGTTIKGELEPNSPLHIDGVVEGNIFSESEVSVGIDGEVFGFVSAKHLIVSGKIKGQIDCNIIEILKGGSVSGDVNSREIILEEGGYFHGHSYGYKQENFHNVLPKEILEKLQNQRVLGVEYNSDEESYNEKKLSEHLL